MTGGTIYIFTNTNIYRLNTDLYVCSFFSYISLFFVFCFRWLNIRIWILLRTFSSHSWLFGFFLLNIHIQFRCVHLWMVHITLPKEFHWKIGDIHFMINSTFFMKSGHHFDRNQSTGTCLADVHSMSLLVFVMENLRKIKN